MIGQPNERSLQVTASAFYPTDPQIDDAIL